MRHDRDDDYYAELAGLLAAEVAAAGILACPAERAGLAQRVAAALAVPVQCWTQARPTGCRSWLAISDRYLPGLREELAGDRPDALISAATHLRVLAGASAHADADVDQHPPQRRRADS